MTLDDGATIPARTVIIATGARYRKPPLANLGQFEGAGVYYSATFMEAAQLGPDDEVIVVGGANSAGQAAVFLAQTTRRVHVLVRSGKSLREHVAISDPPHRGDPGHPDQNANRDRALEGNGHLERVHWRDGTGTVTSHEIRHVFLMTGAEANTGWLNGRVTLDEKGFVKTGPDLTRDDLAGARWPLERPPICSKPPIRASSRWATFAAATSSAWPRLWVKDRSPCRMSIACWPNSLSICASVGHALSSVAGGPRSPRRGRYGRRARTGSRRIAARSRSPSIETAARVRPESKYGSRSR